VREGPGAVLAAETRGIPGRPTWVAGGSCVLASGGVAEVGEGVGLLPRAVEELLAGGDGQRRPDAVTGGHSRVWLS
jgi:hypothetical protein